MAFEKEHERIRIEKEKEVARLRALQERASDEQAERDALRAKRAQEQNERQWRRKVCKLDDVHFLIDYYIESIVQNGLNNII